MSLGDALEKLISKDEPTAVDVAMKLLDPTDVIMHTEIRDPRTMNQLKLMIEYCTQKGELEEANLWKQAYDARALHMVSYQRKREGVIAKMFASLQAYFMGQPNGQNQFDVKHR